jgi:hypothetical protein
MIKTKTQLVVILSCSLIVIGVYIYLLNMILNKDMSQLGKWGAIISATLLTYVELKLITKEV